MTFEERVAKASERVARLTELLKVWTEAAWEASLAARRAHAQLPNYLAARGYLHTGTRHEQTHTGSRRHELEFEHEKHPHKQVVLHSTGEWEVHDLKRQGGEAYSHRAVARGKGANRLRAAVRTHH